MLHPHGLGSFRLELCPPSTIAPLLNFPLQGTRTKVRAAEALRFAVEELRIPKPSAHGLTGIAL